jgi:hypothetical protein
VAKLVDAPGLGPDAVTGVRVRVPPFAPTLLFDTAWVISCAFRPLCLVDFHATCG